MTNRVSSVVAALFAAVSVAAGEGGNPRCIVLFHDGVDIDAAVADLGKRHGLSADHVYHHALHGFAASLGQARKAVRDDARVKAVVDDAILSLPSVPRLHGAAKGGGAPPPVQPTQTLPTGIRRIGADRNALAAIDGVDQRADVDVAVIDTGIDLNHPDLNVSAARAFNAIRASSSATDDNGHGTHCAGTIAALDNAIGVVGVAPGARLWAVKVLSRSGSGSLSDIAKGIDFVADPARGIEVANMSLGGNALPAGTRDVMREAIQRAVGNGVVFAVAAGNEARDASLGIPANYPEVIPVSAIVDSDALAGGLGAGTDRGPDDSLASFSNFFASFAGGGADLALAAPGVDILSTSLAQGYAVLDGTSMASPHVAGAIALHIAANPRPAGLSGLQWTNQVRAALIGQSVLQSDPAGFTGGKSAERLLSVAPSAPASIAPAAAN